MAKLLPRSLVLHNVQEAWSQSSDVAPPCVVRQRATAISSGAVGTAFWCSFAGSVSGSLKGSMRRSRR
eukprot:2473029-Amphidinium_carterae.1